ncbi:DnaJ domain-containing protein [Pleurocapsales cyanobacterium LEGE 06147]|nr:DnaJ domain-containing protein [Pleurocapsales cyanobacterium LEGE 06147]
MGKAENYYKILQVSPDDTVEAIKAAFRRLARRYHPDLNPDDPVAAEQFKLISQAYEVLSDSNRRRRYDREFRSHRQQQTKQTETAQNFYLKGIQQSQAKQYQQAIDSFTKAIEIEPSFIDAYLKRCEIRYKIGDTQGVLQDCYEVIKIDPTVAKAYYYQGRARYRLGYTQSAIKAYTEALYQETNYAQAYYYRGLAYQELKENALAIENLQTAAELFRSQGNWSAYRLSKKAIKNLDRGKQPLNRFFCGVGSIIFKYPWTSLALFLFNPAGGLLPAFSRLEKGQAIAVGIFYGALADLWFVGGTYLSWPNSEFPLLPLLAIGIIPFLSLVVTSKFIRIFYPNSGNLEADFFVVGAFLIPVGLMALMIGIISFPLSILALPFLIFGCCYAILTLYAGCSQIWNLAEAKAAFVVPFMLLVSSSLCYLAWKTIIE